MRYFITFAHYRTHLYGRIAPGDRHRNGWRKPIRLLLRQVCAHRNFEDVQEPLPYAVSGHEASQWKFTCKVGFKTPLRIVAAHVRRPILPRPDS